MKLSAGAATRDISPRKPTALFGYPHVERISTGVHDPLLASALYLSNGSESLLIMALDLLFIDPPTARELRATIAERLSIPEEHVFISCTHTHSGPVTINLISWQNDPAVPAPDPLYMKYMKEEVIKAATEAAAKTRPAEFVWTNADASGIGGNRISQEGVTDPEVGILAVREAGGGSLVAGMLIYGMHPTVMHEDSTLVSSDFPFYTRLRLQEEFGRHFTVLYHNAPCGNQSPRYFVKGQTFEEAERLGRGLGEPVANSLRKLSYEDFSTECVLRGLLSKVDLLRRKLPSMDEAERNLAAYRADYERLKSENAPHGPLRTAECAVFGGEGTLMLARAQERGEIDAKLKAYLPVEIQVLRVGDVYLAGLPGELFTEYALDIKGKAPRKTFVISLANGELQGYIVTPEVAEEGGYEVANSLFDPLSGRILVDRAISMIEDLRARDANPGKDKDQR